MMTTAGDAYDVPLNVISVRDAVVVIGPGSAALAITPSAAVASAERLLVAAREAASGTLEPLEDIP